MTVALHPYHGSKTQRTFDMHARVLLQNWDVGQFMCPRTVIIQARHTVNLSAHIMISMVSDVSEHS